MNDEFLGRVVALRQPFDRGARVMAAAVVQGILWSLAGLEAKFAKLVRIARGYLFASNVNRASALALRKLER